MKILVINAGSSSLKYQFLDSATKSLLAKGNCERIGIDGSFIRHTVTGRDQVGFDIKMNNHNKAVKAVIDILTSKKDGVIKDMSEIDAVGHRVVHGGEAFSSSAIIDENVKDAIRKCYDLAPLHNPANMTGILACEAAMPGTPQVAVFDTAFHQTMPNYAYTYGLPYKYYRDHDVRRYGFHGTSHDFVAKRAAELMGKDIADLKIVTCHLGNGSSIAAVDGGKSVDTSMGMTPIAGLPMGTRCGDIDIAIISHLLEKGVLSSVKEADRVMNKESGVLGISGISSDFRDLVAAAEEGNKRATLALDVFGYEIKKFIGSYAAAMGGADAIVFTAGIGENTPEVRERAVKGLEFMGVSFDYEKNKTFRGEGELNYPDSKVKVLVIPTNEELSIAREVLRLVKE